MIYNGCILSYYFSVCRHIVYCNFCIVHRGIYSISIYRTILFDLIPVGTGLGNITKCIKVN